MLWEGTFRAANRNVSGAPIEVTIKPLGSERRGAFCCGVTVIDNFFKNNARKDHEKYKVRVFVAIIEGIECPVGFYSLSLMAYVPENVGTDAQAKFDRVKSVPAIYLAMLGVHREYQSRKIGRQLMQNAFDRALQIAENAGAYALALDAYSEAVALYYEKVLGFQRFNVGELKMYIPLAAIRTSKL